MDKILNSIKELEKFKMLMEECYEPSKDIFSNTFEITHYRAIRLRLDQEKEMGKDTSKPEVYKSIIADGLENFGGGTKEGYRDRVLQDFNEDELSEEILEHLDTMEEWKFKDITELAVIDHLNDEDGEIRKRILRGFRATFFTDAKESTNRNTGWRKSINR